MITFGFNLKPEFKLFNKQTENFDQKISKYYTKSSDSISLVALWMTQAGSNMNWIMVKWMWNTEPKERDRPVIHFIKHNPLADTEVPQDQAPFEEQMLSDSLML